MKASVTVAIASILVFGSLIADGVLLSTLAEVVTQESPVAETPLFELKVSDYQAEIIDEIITTMGRTNVIALGFKQGHLKALGMKLQSVGASQFLAYVFTRDYLRAHLHSIHQSSFKWNGFVDGLKTGLNREADSGELFKTLPGFARLVGADYQELLAQANERNWPDFIQTMLNAK